MAKRMRLQSVFVELQPRNKEKDGFKIRTNPVQLPKLLNWLGLLRIPVSTILYRFTPSDNTFADSEAMWSFTQLLERLYGYRWGMFEDFPVTREEAHRREGYDVVHKLVSYGKRTDQNPDSLLIVATAFARVGWPAPEDGTPRPEGLFLQFTAASRKPFVGRHKLGSLQKLYEQVMPMIREYL